MAIIIGLSGGIASGKTAVSDIFQSLGVPVIDADLLSRQAVEPGSAGLTLIRQRFGDEVISPDGSLNRSQLREVVFSDKTARADLESIVHPEVRRLTDLRLEQHRAENVAYCLVVIPLLLETGQQDKYDHIIIVDVSTDTQIHRVMQRDDSSEAHARQILKSQADREQRLAIADSVIDNSGSIEALQPQVQAIHQLLLQRSGSAIG